MPRSWPRSFSADLILLVPPCGRSVLSMENVGVEHLAACARADGLKAEIINCGLHGLDERQVVEVLAGTDFRVLAVSVLHQTYISGLWIAKEMKRIRPEVRVIFGGLEAGLGGAGILRRHEFIDAVCLGEGERLLPAYCRAVMTGRSRKGIPGLIYREGTRVRGNARARLIEDLDALPYAVRDDIERVSELGGPVAISTSRGCFGKCKFCSVRAFYALSDGKVWRGRSARSVVAEMKFLNETHGADLFAFIDETVAGPGRNGTERLEEIADLLLDSGMDVEFFAAVRADQVERKLFTKLKKAGLSKVEIGIESMSQEQLRRYGKSTSVEKNWEALRILDSLDISCEEFMIPFDSGMSVLDFRKNLDFFEERFLRAKNTMRYTLAPLVMGQYLYPYPGTAAHEGYLARFGGHGKFYLEYRADDERMELIHRLFTIFLAVSESAFPISSLGFGNLWRRKRTVSPAHYRELTGCAADFGLNCVKFLRRTLSWLDSGGGKPLSSRVPEFQSVFSAHAAAAERIRSRVVRIAGCYAGRSQRRVGGARPDGTFSSALGTYSRPIREGRIFSALSGRAGASEPAGSTAAVLEAYFSRSRKAAAGR